jgi:uncharacterized protein
MRRRNFIAFGLGVAGLLAGERSWAQDMSMYKIIPRAAERGDFDGTQQLLLRGDNVDTVIEETGRTGLSVAAGLGNVQIMNLLLDHGATVDYRDLDGNTPLHWAALNGQTAAIKRLVAAKAEVDATNKRGITPLMLAVDHNRREPVAALLAAGANPLKQDFTGRDAYGWAQGRALAMAVLPPR